MASFIPAAFSLYEFDDSGLADSGDVPVRRWLSHWDGLIGSPAEEVSLAWACGRAAVLVCTSGRSYDEAGARARAAHVALGGDALPIPHRPASTAGTVAEIERLGSAAELWSGVTGVLPGAPAAEAAEGDGFAVADIRLSSGAAFIAAVGADPRQFRIRKVRDWDAYDVNATTQFPLSALNR
ncbi:MAG: hypothetical protein ACR2MP_12970 [Streptosporangiaceae bacterium]